MFIEAGFFVLAWCFFCLSVFLLLFWRGLGGGRLLNICVWVSFWACSGFYFIFLTFATSHVILSQSKITAVCKSLCGGETRDWSKQNFSRMLNKYKCSISANKWYEIDENKCVKVKAYLLRLEKIWVISVLERDQ